MTINQNVPNNMGQVFQNSEALTKLAVAENIAGPTISTGSQSMAADPAGAALQELNYAMEGQVLSIQSAAAASIVSLTV